MTPGPTSPTDPAAAAVVHAPTISGIIPTREIAVTGYKHSEPKTEHVQVAKTRRCLKCREEFESSWSGERICKQCKSNMEHRGAGMDAGRFMER